VPAESGAGVAGGIAVAEQQEQLERIHERDVLELSGGREGRSRLPTLDRPAKSAVMKPWEATRTHVLTRPKEPPDAFGWASK
jgi:hypothetical protein